MSDNLFSSPPPTVLSVPLENRGEYSVFHVEKPGTLEQAVRWVTAAIVQAREQGVSKLLVEAKSVAGFDSPSLPDRYHYVREWATAGRGMVRIAMVLPPEMIDPEKFGVNVALRSGLVADVFTEESAAVAWLANTKVPIPT